MILTISRVEGDNRLTPSGGESEGKRKGLREIYKGYSLQNMRSAEDCGGTEYDNDIAKAMWAQYIEYTTNQNR